MTEKNSTINKFLFHLGNILIILSLVGFALLFYPFLKIYFFPPQITPIQKVQAKEGTFITIPKIHAQSPIIEQVDPWNQSEYMSALKKGVAQAKGTALPGQKGTMFLFAHSSGAPWDMTWSNTIFLRLGELKQGDTIFIDKNGKQYKYTVREKKVVAPTEVQYLINKGQDQLILQTCTPIGTAINRLLIFADPEKNLN